MNQLLKFSMLMVALISLSCGNTKGEYSIAKIDAGQGRSIEILASYHMEVTQSFYYQVRVGDRIIVPICMICAGHDTGKFKFKTIVAKKGDLVGVYEQKYPDEILAMHDFSSNTTWPSGKESPTHLNQLGEELLKELQVEHKEIKLKKGQDSACE